MPEQPTPERFSDWNEEMVARHDPEKFHSHPRAVVRWVEGARVRAVLKLVRVRPQDRVLEVGCGAGNVLGQAPAREWHAVDLSRRLTARCRERLGRRSCVLLADAEMLPYQDNVFDAVICSSVLSHVLHPERVLEEAFRVLKPGGRLAVSVSDESVIERGIRLARRLGLARLLVGDADSPAHESVYASEYHLHRFDLDRLRRAAQNLPRERRFRKAPSFLGVHLVALYQKQ